MQSCGELGTNGEPVISLSGQQGPPEVAGTCCLGLALAWGGPRSTGKSHVRRHIHALQMGALLLAQDAPSSYGSHVSVMLSFSPQSSDLLCCPPQSLGEHQSDSAEAQGRVAEGS